MAGPRFRNLCVRLGVPADEAANAAAALRPLYAEPHRAYHNYRHIRDVLRKLDWSKRSLAETGELSSVVDVGALFDTVELALWFHDAVYNPVAKDNEAKSAGLVARFLPSLPVLTCDRVERLILLTASHGKKASAEEEVLLSGLAGRLMSDCDLSVLGAPFEAFKAYDAGIRREYSFVPEEQYGPARKSVLQSFRIAADADALFKTQAFQLEFGAQARSNLARAVKP